MNYGVCMPWTHASRMMQWQHYCNNFYGVIMEFRSAPKFIHSNLFSIYFSVQAQKCPTKNAHKKLLDSSILELNRFSLWQPRKILCCWSNIFDAFKLEVICVFLQKSTGWKVLRLVKMTIFSVNNETVETLSALTSPHCVPWTIFQYIAREQKDPMKMEKPISWTGKFPCLIWNFIVHHLVFVTHNQMGHFGAVVRMLSAPFNWNSDSKPSGRASRTLQCYVHF